MNHIVTIRSHVRSLVYKCAFHKAPNAACGLLLGNVHEKRVEYALPMIEGLAWSDFRQTPTWIDAHAMIAGQVAAHCQENIVGIYVAVDDDVHADRNEVFGFIVDSLVARKLPILCVFSTLAGESIWGIAVYWAGAFPHDPLKYKMLPRKSVAVEHNPRRVLALWNGLRKQIPNNEVLLTGAPPRGSSNAYP